MIADAGNRGSRISKENTLTLTWTSTARCWMPTMLLYQLQAFLPRPKEITSVVLMLRSLCSLAEQCMCVGATLDVSNRLLT